MANDVLFIVEGEDAEPKLLDKINGTLKITEDINIYSYGTMIYQLYDELSLDDDLDIVLFLKSKENNKRKKEMLSKEFEAIYLIFDFEPHHEKFTIDKILEMSHFFNDSLDKGLLLINYPMVESYKHLNQMPDCDFINKTVTKDQVLRYKELVGKESKYTNITLYHRSLILELIVHHLIKFNYLANNDKSLPSYHIAMDLVHNKDFIRYQYEQYENDKIYPLATIYFYIIELKPKSFYDELKLPIVNELCK